MTTTPRHPLVEDYLAQLERRSVRLPPDARQELLAEIRDHVDAGADDARSEADIRNMLDSLGSPEDIVRESEPDTAPMGTPTGPTGKLALGFGIAALVLLPSGFFSIPFAITAVILGIRARRSLRAQGAPTSMATAGLVTGGAALAVVVLLYVALVGGRSTTGSSEPVQDRTGPTTLEAPTTTGAG